MLSLSIALGWYTVDLVLVISTLGTILPVEISLVARLKGWSSLSLGFVHFGQ